MHSGATAERPFTTNSSVHRFFSLCFCFVFLNFYEFSWLIFLKFYLIFSLIFKIFKYFFKSVLNFLSEGPPPPRPAGSRAHGNRAWTLRAAHCAARSRDYRTLIVGQSICHSARGPLSHGPRGGSSRVEQRSSGGRLRRLQGQGRQPAQLH